MSCSVYARGIIGVKLPRPPFKEVKERGCEHALSEKEFCGTCGSKSWVAKPQALFDEDDCTVGKFRLLEGGNADNPDYYVGIFPTHTDADCMYGHPGEFVGDLSGLDVGLLKSQLKALLEPLDLWVDDMDTQVGLWIFGFVSF